MSQQKLIEIAKECGELYKNADDNDILEFAQRIEQPLQYKINELTFDVSHQQTRYDVALEIVVKQEQQIKQLTDELETEREELRSLESDITCYENDEIKLNEKIDQLRKALEEVLWDQTHENLEKARKVLRETE